MMLSAQTIVILQQLAQGRFKSQLAALVYRMPAEPFNEHALLSLAQSLNPNFTQANLADAKQRAQEIITLAEKQGIHLLAPGDAHFPQTLTTINNPPVVLYAKGDLAALTSEYAVAVVGTRNPTEYGKAVAARFGQRLVEQAITVISGLAIGCDTAAHQGALNGKGRTVAILAHGLDSIYPAQNRALADTIIKNGGCLISEYAPGVKAQKQFFVERDRLQSGLSQGVIIVESAKDGGTMHTANFARQQWRLLACNKPAADFKVKYPQADLAGNELLLSKGAIVLETAEDLSQFISDVKKKDDENLNPSRAPVTSSSVGLQAPAPAVKRPGNQPLISPFFNAHKRKRIDETEQKPAVVQGSQSVNQAAMALPDTKMPPSNVLLMANLYRLFLKPSCNRCEEKPNGNDFSLN